MTTNFVNSRFGHNVLHGFDVWEDTRDFLADVIESFGASAETEGLLRLSLTAGAEDWSALIECAESIRRIRGHAQEGLEGHDLATYVHEILNGLTPSPYSARAWEQTDRLIAQAKALERDAGLWTSASFAPIEQPHDNNTEWPTSPLATPGTKESRAVTSNYWPDQPHAQGSGEGFDWDNTPASLVDGSFAWQQNSFDNYSGLLQLEEPKKRYSLRHRPSLAEAQTPTESLTPSVKRSSAVSPYFTPLSASEQQRSPTKARPPAGTVSAVPFAPLTSPNFGIVQELFAHDPFWLLIVVTFLIKTNGKLAVPVFYKVKERFPTPEQIADPANKGEIVAMIRHLGLSLVRVAFMQKYAQGFLEAPPTPSSRYMVKNYDRRDVDPSRVHCAAFDKMAPTDGADGEDAEAWEIGHLTQGKYALDSWRIFCRDELLGRAKDWNGLGREPEFQPEWMRVMPRDKELRAYLRWMWMREGWEWDPETGERSVLREEMRQAVNEGRVEYDETGGLRIV